MSEREFTYLTCPLCEQRIAYCDWPGDEATWWAPHICKDSKSLFWIPKDVVTVE